MKKYAFAAIPLLFLIVPLCAVIGIAATGGLGGAGCQSSAASGAFDIEGGVSTPITGSLTVAQANIPQRSGLDGYRASMPKVLSRNPDFVTLNEQAGRTLPQLLSAAPGYRAYRDPTPASDPGSGQANDTVVLYRAGWTFLDGGRVQLVDDDHTIYDGHPVVWDRYATWTLLQRPTDSAIVAVIAVHHMTNPATYGPDKPGRQAQYAQGMDTLLSLVAALERHGPVLIGGDFNVSLRQIASSWTAPAKMRAAGSAWAAHSVDYVFYPRRAGVTIEQSWSGTMRSDHQWVAARLKFNGVSEIATREEQARTSAVVAHGLDASFVRDAAGNYHLREWHLTADQHANAVHITTEATRRGGTQAAVVAITTALTESGLSTNPGTLGGAYGIFQQTPPDWGTREQVLNVAYATNAFLNHLLQIPAWQTVPAWQAAQTVQRSGAGAATNGRANYGPKVAEATAIVTALTGIAVATPAQVNCLQNVSAPTGGSGPFAANTEYAYVGPYDPAELAARMQQITAANGASNVDPYFSTQPDGSWHNNCQQFVAVLAGRAHSGYPTARAAWNHFVATGAAHPAGGGDGMSPPIGAWLYYADNHVVTYLGNNLVAGTDTWGDGTAKTGPAADISGGIWNLSYLGWTAP